MAKVINDFVKTAEAIKEGKNLVVKRVYKKDGSSVEIYASNASNSDWKYIGEVDNDFENENDFVDSDTADDLDYETKAELLPDKYIMGDDDWWPQSFFDNNYLTLKYLGVAETSNIYRYFRSLELNGGKGNSYMKGLGKLLDLKFASELTKALRGKLNAIPFKDLKKMFDLPGQSRTWKDLKTNKLMSKDMKDRVRAFKALHKGGSRLIENGIRAIKNNKPLPNGLTKKDIRKLFIIMIANKKIKGGK